MRIIMIKHDDYADLEFSEIEAKLEEDVYDLEDLLAVMRDFIDHCGFEVPEDAELMLEYKRKGAA